MNIITCWCDWYEMRLTTFTLQEGHSREITKGRWAYGLDSQLSVIPYYNHGAFNLSFFIRLIKVL